CFNRSITALGRMVRPPPMRVREMGGGCQDEAGAVDCLDKTGMGKQLEFANTPFDQAVFGRAVTAGERVVGITGVAGELDNVAGDARDPTDQVIRVIETSGVGDTGKPIVPRKTGPELFPRLASAQERQ